MKNLRIKQLPSGNFLAIAPYSGFWGIIPTLKKIKELREKFKEVKVELEKTRLYETQQRKIYHIELHPTEECNLNCGYCYVPPNLREFTPCISMEIAKPVLSKVEDYAKKEALPYVTVTFHGGEPLLCKENVREIIEYFYPHNLLKFDIQTNGTLLDEEFLKEIKRYNVQLGFSLDGWQELHDKERKFKNGRGSYEKVLEAIELYKIYHKKICLICVVHKFNVEFLQDILHFFHRLGVFSLFLNPVSPSRVETQELVPNIPTLIKHYKEAITSQIEINKNNSPENRIFINNVEALFLNIVADYQPCVCYQSPCGAGREMFILMSNGDVYPCSEFISKQEFRLGNLITEDLEKILQHRVCRALRRREVKRIPKCKECLYAYICCGNCPFSSYFHSGWDIYPLLVRDTESLKNSEMYYNFQE